MWSGAVSETTEEACIIKIESPLNTDGNWSSDPRLRQTNVVVCTASCTLIGTVHLLPQQRLLDELNTSVVANMHHLGEGFMPLTEVRILFPSGEKDVALSTHVRKSSMLFVAERSAGQSDGNGVKEGKAHPMRIKKPLSARVCTPPYTIEGKMHVGLWQDLAQALDGDNRFLPMTDVLVSPALLNGESTCAFVAINKDQIVHIGELSEALQRLRQDAQRVLSTEQRVVVDLVAGHQP